MTKYKLVCYDCKHPIYSNDEAKICLECGGRNKRNKINISKFKISLIKKGLIKEGLMDLQKILNNRGK